MAKPKSNVAVNTELLAAIKSGKVTHVTQAEAVEAGLQHVPPLVEVNIDPSAIVDGKAPVRLSEAGHKYIPANAETASAPAASPYTIMSGVVLPASKRGGGGGGGAPKKYPFDQLEVGQTFFVPASAAVPDPVKKLGSTVSSANMRYAVETGETKEVERTKRGPGNKAVVDPATGQNVREKKTVPVYKQTRKFTIRPVVGGEKYGDWTAPANGAVIGRVM